MEQCHSPVARLVAAREIQDFVGILPGDSVVAAVGLLVFEVELLLEECRLILVDLQDLFPRPEVSPLHKGGAPFVGGNVPHGGSPFTCKKQRTRV